MDSCICSYKIHFHKSSRTLQKIIFMSRGKPVTCYIYFPWAKWRSEIKLYALEPNPNTQLYKNILTAICVFNYLSVHKCLCSCHSEREAEKCALPHQLLCLMMLCDRNRPAPQHEVFIFLAKAWWLRLLISQTSATSSSLAVWRAFS